jgi:hypothetical protein
MPQSYHIFRRLPNFYPTFFHLINIFCTSHPRFLTPRVPAPQIYANSTKPPNLFTNFIRLNT